MAYLGSPNHHYSSLNLRRHTHGPFAGRLPTKMAEITSSNLIRVCHEFWTILLYYFGKFTRCACDTASLWLSDMVWTQQSDQRAERKSTLNGWQSIFDRLMGRWVFNKPSQYVSIALCQNKWCLGIPSINDKTPSGPLKWTDKPWDYEYIHASFPRVLLNGDWSLCCYVLPPVLLCS